MSASATAAGSGHTGTEWCSVTSQIATSFNPKLGLESKCWGFGWIEVCPSKFRRNKGTQLKDRRKRFSCVCLAAMLVALHNTALNECLYACVYLCVYVYIIHIYIYVCIQKGFPFLCLLCAPVSTAACVLHAKKPAQPLGIGEL